ncbi:MAG: efflux RND transporter permease subunit [Pseudomonadota bacterium]
MNFTWFFIKRPVTTTLVMMSILIFGLMAYNHLPVNDLPNVDFPTLLVEARVPGASPENMASSVATPLEGQFTTIAGLTSMTSSSYSGITQITLQFDLNRSLDEAALDVQAAIAQTAPRLPRDMPYPPSYRKVNPADMPVLYLALTSPTLPLYSLNEYGETLLARRISTVSGVAQVLVYGSQKYAVRIQVDPKAIKGRRLGIDDVVKAVKTANTNLPTGTLSGHHWAYTLETTGQLNGAKDFNPIIIASRHGHPIRLQDIGVALDSVEMDKAAAWYGDERAIVLAIQRQPGTNTIEVADAVKKLLPAFKAQLPASVSLEILFDRSDSIRESARDVQFTLLFALGLVVLVIFLFLRKISATMIASVAIPMSIIGTFAVMYLLGYSLNNLSLMALILAVGFVVDDAIVMLENIVRHTERGEGVYEAALNGSKEISFTIVSMTLSLAAVFIPVLFMGGLIGRLFTEFAVTIGAAVLISGFIALTLTPMLCSRFIKSATHINTDGHADTNPNKALGRMLRVYSAGLRWFLRHRLLTMIFTGLIFVGTVSLFRTLPKGFIPSEDTGRVIVYTEAVEGISFQSMVDHQKAAADMVKTDPNIEGFFSSAGARGRSGRSNSGILFIRLKSRKERRLKIEEVIAQMRPKLGQIPGLRFFIQNPPPIRIGGMVTKSLYQYTLQGADTDELYKYALQMEEKIRALPGLLDVNTDLEIKNPQVTVDIDRDKTALLGLNPEQIEDALYTAYGSRQISTISTANNDYQVIMEVKPEYQLEPAALSLLHIRSLSGQLVPLDAVCRFISSVGPAAVNHLGQLPAVTISFNLKPGAPLGESIDAVDRIAKTTLPATISTSFQGTAQAFQESFAGMGLLLLLAVVVIYMVLGILYENFFHPITILSALPFAGFGALITLFLFKSELNIYAFVGLVMLVGLVKKNGIMMIDFAIEARKDGSKTSTEAIHEACLIRFRPIMMTTMAALMGTLPIALGYGAGGEARQPLGLTVVGGLLFSQFLTLFVTPVFFVYMEAFQEWLHRLRGR